MGKAVKCAGCGKRRDRAGQRYCRKCHAAYQKNWREGRKKAAAIALENIKRQVAALEVALRGLST